MISIKRSKTSSQESDSSSAETIANNVDLLDQILRRLPSKSLLKFKCVSKQWQSLISSPTFTRCRKSHVNSPCALMLISENISREYEFVSLNSSHSEAPFRSLTFVNAQGNARILQSCNGLLLCVRYISQNLMINYVCNPTTKQCIQLPPLESPYISINDVGLNLAFDPLKSPYYKVVCVRKCGDSLFGGRYEPGDEAVYEIDVFCSKERRWMSSKASPFTIYRYIPFGKGVFCNGAIHWLCTDGNGNSLYLDVDEDQLHEMPSLSFPEDEERGYFYFGESRGHLHLVQNYDSPSIKFNVYEMPLDYSGWNVKYKVDLAALVTAFPEMSESLDDDSFHYLFQILCVSRGETDDDSFLVINIPSKIRRFSLKDGTFEKLCDFGPEELGPSPYMLSPNAYEYYESLACLM